MRVLNVVLLGAVAGGLGLSLFLREPIKAEPAEEASIRPGNLPALSPASDSSSVEGQVLEVIDVPSYTYLRIGEPGSDGTWAAVSTAKLKVGDPARVVSATKMTGFRSETLNRSFDEIYFGALEAAGPNTANAEQLTAVAGGTDPHAAPAQAAEVKVGKVDKAKGDNAQRVADVYAKKAGLAGKTVRVRGVVVKSTPGILGKTFLHLRDGSGDVATANNDLAVTLQETPKVGETITVEGTVVTDKDIGAGYRYAVMIEQAQVKPN